MQQGAIISGPNQSTIFRYYFPVIALSRQDPDHMNLPAGFGSVAPIWFNTYQTLHDT